MPLFSPASAGGQSLSVSNTGSLAATGATNISFTGSGGVLTSVSGNDGIAYIIIDGTNIAAGAGTNYWETVSGSVIRNTGSAILSPNGTLARPGIAWKDEPGSGIRRQDGDIPMAVVLRGTDFMRFRGDGKMGIFVDNPIYPIHLNGDMCVQNGGYNFRHPSSVESDLIFFRGGPINSGSFQFRRIGQHWTILEVHAPASPYLGYEATIALTRDLTNDTPDVNLEFIDIYNNGYPPGEGTEQQYGMRIQKRGTGIWRDFAFDFWEGLGTNKVEALRVKPTQMVGIGGVTEPSTSLHVSGSGFTCWGKIAHMSGNVGFFSAEPVAQRGPYTITNTIEDRSYDANATSVEELADILGTLIADLKAYGLLS